MKKMKYILKKTHDADKEKFAELLLAAKGGRTMKDFAELCGANPSTFTRIIQKVNKGASSPELIEAIAEHASPNSGVTIETLADANGYKVETDSGLKVSSILQSRLYAERLMRDVITQALIDRNQAVRMGNIRYNFSKHLELRPDLLIMTEAFGKKDEIWFIESLYIRTDTDIPHRIEYNSRQRAFDRISRFVFISMNKIELFRPTRFSLVVYDRAVFDLIVDEFCETTVPTDISIILIDMINSTIADEFMLPHIEKGQQDSYFMTTAITEFNENNYINIDDEDE